MTVSVSVEPHAAVPASRSGAFSHFWLLEWGAGVFALALVLTSMLLFVMNTVADRVDTLIAEQNTDSLKLSDNLNYFAALHVPNDTPAPPDLFSNLVEFSRKTAIIIYEVHRLSPFETFGLEGESWSEGLLKKLKPKDATKTIFNHTGVDPRTKSENLFETGAYQIELYQSLRDFSQERCTSYKDIGGAISTYVFPVLYALLGAFLCDLRCRLMPEARRPASLGSARYTTSIIAGAVLGIFTSLIPTSLSLPPLLVAFLLGYSADFFIARLDALIDKLRAHDRELSA
jgi:hypothetical protein